jgi:pentatricopeptide repeat protein
MRKLDSLLWRLGRSWTPLEERLPWSFVWGQCNHALRGNGDAGVGRMRGFTAVADFCERDKVSDGLCKGLDGSGWRFYSTEFGNAKAGRERREDERGSGSTWSLISCNAAISRLAQQGRRGEAFALFFRMQDEHVRPNRVTFLSLLKAFTGPRDLESGKRVHDVIFERHLEADVRVGTALICMYFRCGSPQDAHRVFIGIRQRDIILWNAMIEGYCQVGLRDRALETFGQMRSAGVVPDIATFLSILKSCNDAAHLDEGKQLHRVIVESGFELSVRVQSALVSMYCKCGSLVDARRVFDKLPRKDVGLWTSMMAGYAQAGHGREAFELFQAMRDAGMHPNKMTFLALLKACTRPEFLDKGKWLHNHIRLAGYESDEKVGTALINTYCKCRSLSDARQVFDNLPKKNVISWTALIAGYAHNGRAEEALDLFEQMQKEGVQPNEVTRNTVVDACDRLGAV